MRLGNIRPTCYCLFCGACVTIADLAVPSDDTIPLTVIGWGAKKEGGSNVANLAVSKQTFRHAVWDLI